MSSFLDNSKLLFDKAHEMGLHPNWLHSYGLFSIKVGNKIGYVFAGTSMLNTHLSSYLTRNKHATRVILELHNLPNIPFAVPETLEDAQGFLKKHTNIIIKPTMGTGSQNVHLVTTLDDMKDLVLTDYIFEKYIQGEEMRYLVLNNNIIAVHKRILDGFIYNPMSDTHIALPRKQWDKQLIAIARDCLKALHLNFGAVDFIVDTKKNYFILEVNASPGLKWFKYPVSGPAIDIARLFLEATIEKISKEDY